MRHALSRRGQWTDYLNIQGCRITTESGVPVSTLDRTSQGNLYLTPANGNLITLPTGVKNSCVTIPFAETLLGLTVTSGKNYDAFAYLLGNSGFGYDLGPAWTDDTTRATAVELFNGYYVNSSSFVGSILGKTIPARRGLLVGTIRASGANVVEDSDLNRLVSNLYNTVPRRLRYAAADSHVLNNSAWQEWNGGTAERLNLVLVLANQSIKGTVKVRGGTTTTQNTVIRIGLDGIGAAYNTTFAFSQWQTAQASANTNGIISEDTFIPSAGFHFLAVGEQQFDSVNVTYDNITHLATINN